MKSLLISAMLAVLGLGCASTEEGNPGSSDSNVEAAKPGAAGSCTIKSETPCTPAVGSPERTTIVRLLRAKVRGELAKGGKPPGDDDVKFVFKRILLQKATHVADGATAGAAFVDAKLVLADGVTAFDLEGTKVKQEFDELGAPGDFVNRVQASLSIDPAVPAGGGVLHHVVGEPGDVFGCHWWTLGMPKALFPNNQPESECKQLGDEFSGLFRDSSDR
jgi:hypothetical protein